MEIELSEKEGILIFRLRGSIISPGVKEVSETVEEALAMSSSPPKLLFDFKEVAGIDSSGLGALMSIYSRIHPHCGKIAVINVNKRVKNLIVMARLITVFKSFESEEAAVAALLRHPRQDET